MTSLLIAFLLVVMAPLFIAAWRTSLMGLALQGLLMAWMVVERGWTWDVPSVVLFVDLAFVRGLFVPRYLYGILKRRNTPRRNDVISANLLSWTLAGVIVLLSFRFGNAMAGEDVQGATHLAVAASGVLLGFLVLASRESPFSQIIGALRIENGIALFELASEHHQPLPVHLGVAAIYILTVFMFGAFLLRLDPAASVTPAKEETL